VTKPASLVTLERRPDEVALVTIDNPLMTPLFAELRAVISLARDH
jgi:hypothetical protein